MTETIDLEDFLEQYAGEWGGGQSASLDDEQMSLEEYMAKYGRSVKAAQSQQIGADGENAAENALRAYGVRMVEQIATPYTITAKKGDGWVRLKRKTAVSGDRRGVMGDKSGRRVLAEVKSTNGDRIPWHWLKDHQVRALDENNGLGAVSLLVVVFSGVAYVLRWPVSGFLPRTSLRREDVIDKQWDGKS